MPIPFSESENWQQLRKRQTCNATVILSEPEWNCIHEQMIFEQTSILRLTESSICDASIESSLPAIFFVKDFFLLRDVFIVTEKNTLSVFFFSTFHLLVLQRFLRHVSRRHRSLKNGERRTMTFSQIAHTRAVWTRRLSSWKRTDFKVYSCVYAYARHKLNESPPPPPPTPPQPSIIS